MAAKYGWIIIQDLLVLECDSVPSRVGTMGPHNIDPVIAARLRVGEGQAWRCYADDDEPGDMLVYAGRYIGPDDESMFAPLDDFCMPDAGSTTIKYKVGRRWEVL